MRGYTTICFSLCISLAGPLVRAAAPSDMLARARAAGAQGNYAAASQLYADLLAQSNLGMKERRAAYIGRGMARSSAGDFAGAISDYESAMKLDPRASDAYYLRALTRSDLGDYRGALNDLGYIVSAAGIYPRYYLYRGYIYYEVGDYGSAVRDLTLATKTLPSDPEVFYRRAWAYAKQGDRARAMADYGATIRLRPTDATMLSDAYRWHGTEAFALTRYQDAARDFDTLLRLDPTDADGAMRRAYVDYALGAYAAVVSDTSRVIHADTTIERGTVFPWPGVIDPTACLYDRIIEQYNHGIRALGIDPYALVLRARAQLRLGHKNAALADYAAAVRAIPPGADDSVAAEMAAARR